MRPTPAPAAPGQESVWDYPRPPRVERTAEHVVVTLDGHPVAETTDGVRVLETSHPPNYYLPPDDVLPGALELGTGGSFCEWKGRAHYFIVRAGDRSEPGAAWAYASPSPAFAAIRDHVAFYAGRMDSLAAELAGDEAAQAIQLSIEYDPQPPFDSGSQFTAPAHVVEHQRATSRFSQEAGAT